VCKAVLEAKPDAIVHEATALADVTFSRNLDRSLVETNRLRTEGTDALLAAARDAGVPRFVAQSGASYGRYAREGGPIKTEDDPLDPSPAIYNVVDDEPAPVREWLPVVADALGARTPARRRVRGHDRNGGPRRLQREGEARARLDAALPELARRLRGRLRINRPRGRFG
jgi:hypothetical protein